MRRPACPRPTSRFNISKFILKPLSLQRGMPIWVVHVLYEGGPCLPPLTGAGTITGSVFNNAAIGTGPLPGLLAISGNYTEGPSALLAIKLGGTSAGTTYDQLSIGGSAALAGSLNISYWNGFIPSAGDVFTVLACSARTGGFSVVTAPNNDLATLYTATNVLVEPGNAPPTAQLSVPAQAFAGHAFVVAGWVG